MNPTPKKIKAARIKAGLSVMEMVALMGRTKKTIYNWEDGTHPMREQEYAHMLNKIKESQ